MEPKKIMEYLINHIQDVTSVKMSSPKTILINRCYTKKLQKGRFVESKEYKIKLPLVDHISNIIERINTDRFYQAALICAEKIDSEISYFCAENHCKCSIVYCPDYLLVEKFVIEDKEHGLLYQIPIKGHILYDCVQSKFNECINNEIQKNSEYFDESILEYVAKHQSGITTLLLDLQEFMPKEKFSFIYNKHDHTIHIFMNYRPLYDIIIDGNFEFNSLPGKLEEIKPRIRKMEEVFESLKANASKIINCSQYDCIYYPRSDGYRVGIIDPSSDLNVYFDINYDSITDVTRKFNDAISELEQREKQK